MPTVWSLFRWLFSHGREYPRAPALSLACRPFRRNPAEEPRTVFGLTWPPSRVLRQDHGLMVARP